MSYTFTLPGREHLVTLVVHRDGQLEMLNYDAEFDISMAEFGDEETDLLKIYEFWGEDPLHCIFSLFDIRFTDLLRLCLDFMRDSLFYIPSDDHVWFYAVEWLDKIEGAILEIENLGGLASLLSIDDFESKISGKISGLTARFGQEHPIDRRYIILRSIRQLARCVKDTRNIILSYEGSKSLNSSKPYGGSNIYLANHIVNSLQLDVVYDIISFEYTESVSASNPDLEHFVEHFVDYMSDKYAEK